MTDAVRRHDPAGQALPLVFDSPHSGEWYPDDFDHLPPRSLVRQAEDTHVGRLYACAPRQGATLVAAEVAAMGYTVAVNDPYKGVEIVRRHGRPGEGRHSLQVEIKRTLYMDEVTLAPNAGYARLEADVARLVARLAAFVRAATGQTT